MKKPKLTGQVKVAKYYPGKPLPSSPGFTNILIHTKGELSPYVLRDKEGVILENAWQFSKVYPVVDAQRIPLSRWQKNQIIWEHPREEHLDPQGEPNAAYWAWRKKGCAAPYAVRYPNGFHGRKKCLYALEDENGPHLSYLDARKAIYCRIYREEAHKTKEFKDLYERLQGGENLQIVEVDGPDPHLSFPPYDRISGENPGLLMDEETIKLLLGDDRKPFGHGFVIAALLLDGADWLC